MGEAYRCTSPTANGPAGELSGAVATMTLAPAEREEVAMRYPTSSSSMTSVCAGVFVNSPKRRSNTSSVEGDPSSVTNRLSSRS